MSWMNERDALIAQTMAFVEQVAGKMPETREFLAKNGGEPYEGTPAQTKALVDKEIVDWKGYVELGKIEPQ